MTEKNKCIYYGEHKDLNYTKQEHVFPAGLGGNMMLDIAMLARMEKEQAQGMRV